jgi:hypothetical protein
MSQPSSQPSTRTYAGMSDYIAAPELMHTVNVAIQLGRPLLITSNAEKELPDAFLRRCVVHYIEFPDEEMMERIVGVHVPGLERRLLDLAIEAFYWLRRLRRQFDHSVWPNTIPADQWARAYGSTSIRKVGEVFPMFELTVDGLTEAVKKLMVRY